MANSEKHGLARYNAGCRCDLCKQTMSDYRRARRQAAAEAVGESPGLGLAELRLVSNTGDNASTSINAATTPANSVVAAVQAEIDSLGGGKHPSLAAAALSLAAILDNPKATATKPAAAAKLSDLMEDIRRGADRKDSKLSIVRAMTEAKTSSAG